jgi:excinuclease UvrABC nuclease subunit
LPGCESLSYPLRQDRRPPRVFLGGVARVPDRARLGSRFRRRIGGRLASASFEDEPEPSGEAPSFDPGQFFSALLKQLYIDQQYVPRTILVPVDFEDRESLAALLSARTGHRVELAAPQRGDKRSLIDLAGQNAKQSYTQRFRVLEPSRKAIQEALADALMLPDLPRRIECFDISHIQGAETVASMVVWEDGAMKKSAYRKFQVKTVLRRRRLRVHARDRSPAVTCRITK